MSIVDVCALPTPAASGEDSITPSELKARAEANTGGRVVIIAVDATWGNALRTKSGYPPDALYGERGGGEGGVNGAV